mgnify:FL=1
MLTQEDIQKIDEVFSKRLKGEIKPIQEDVSKIRKDIKTIVNFFDQEYLSLRNRVERIEEHLGLQPTL